MSPIQQFYQPREFLHLKHQVARLEDFKVIQNDELNVIEHCNIELDDVEIKLSVQEKLTLNLTWLRDSCHCHQCTHKFSRQRLFTIKNFRKHLFTIHSISLVAKEDAHRYSDSGLIIGSLDSGLLNVTWSDGHASLYSIDWLRQVDKIGKSRSRINLDEVFDAVIQFPEDDYYMSKKENAVVPVNWQLRDLSLTPVSYEVLIDSFQLKDKGSTFINANRITDMSDRRFKATLSLTEQLVRFGLAKVVDVPLQQDQVLKLARSLAYERPTGYGTVFDVTVEPSEDINLAYSSLEFDLHSDLTYRETSPGIQMLHCIKNSVDGGYSYFSDAFKAAEDLKNTDSRLFKVLTQFPATFVVLDPYRQIKFRHHKPILSCDQSGRLKDVYYSPFMLPPVGNLCDLKLFYLALDKFTQLMQAKESKMIVKMNPGELYIFRNRRVLHGRSSYDPNTSRRFLQGCYMDWDEISCLHEKLYSHHLLQTSNCQQ